MGIPGLGSRITTGRRRGPTASSLGAMSVNTSNTATHLMAELCTAQADLCAQLGSSLYPGLLRHCAQDIRAGGPVWTVLRGLADCPPDFYPALRLLGSVHRLVLRGQAPALAAHYPSVGGQPGPGLWEAFRCVVADQTDTLARLVQSPPQTNEVGRAASLLGGFLHVAGETGLPLRLLEVGASAGLNLGWDRYRYESGEWSWGDPASPLRLTDVFVDATPASLPVTVVERLGCDLSPIDLTTEQGQLTLLSYVWPDQIERIERLRAAIRIAVAADPRVHVQRAGAIDWLRQQLAAARPGTATVVFHSIVLSYFDDQQRHAFGEVLAQAGSRATAAAPLAWMSLERSGDQFEVRLRSWPSGEEHLLALVGGHGLPVRWLAGQ